MAANRLDPGTRTMRAHWPGRRTRAFTLVEMMVALGIAVFATMGIMAFFLFSGQSFASIYNYNVLDEETQLAVDKMGKQMRQVSQLSSFSSNNGVITTLNFVDYDGTNLTYTYNPDRKTLVAIKSGVTNTYLRACSSLNFQLFQRNVQSNSFNAYQTAVATNCKLIQVTWTCSQSLGGTHLSDTEVMQTAKITLRAAP